jgi:hypothetical protein
MAKKAAKSKAKPKSAPQPASPSEGASSQESALDAVSVDGPMVIPAGKAESAAGPGGRKKKSTPDPVTNIPTPAVSVRATAVDDETLEDRTQETGRELFARLHRRAPSIFHGRWWEDRLMSWAMNDEAVKVQMFRFVDVLPMLRDHNAIARHLDEYFEEVRDHLPWAARWALIFQPATAFSAARWLLMHAPMRHGWLAGLLRARMLMKFWLRFAAFAETATHSLSIFWAKPLSVMAKPKDTNNRISI